MRHLNWDEIWTYAASAELKLEESGERGKSGELSDTQVIRAHVAQCPACMQRIRNAQVANDGLFHALTADVPAPSTDSNNRILLALSAVRPLPPKSKSRREGTRTWMFPVLGATAVVVFMTAISVDHVDQGLPARSTASTSSASSAASGHNEQTAIGTSDKTAASAAQQPTTSAQASGSKLAGGTKSAGINKSADLTQSTGINKSAAQSTVLSVHVQSPDGAGLPDVNVACVSAGQVIATGKTLSNGNAADMHLHLPADPVMTASLDPLDAPLKTFILVAWKDGNQPIVSYEVGIWQDASTIPVILTMNPARHANSVEVLPLGDRGYHILTFDNYGRSANQQAMDPANIQPPQLNQESGRFRVKVVDQAGHPVSGANVIVVAGSTINGKSVTTPTGDAAPIATTGIPDWRFLPDALHDAPNVASVVVWKDGYAAAVGLYQPVNMGEIRQVTVRIESIPWRQSLKMNNTDAAVEVPGALVPSQSDALGLVQWVSKQTQ